MDIKVVLPAGVKDKIGQIASSKTEARHLYRICNYVLYRHYVTERLFEEPAEISAKHFRNNIGTHYNPYLKKLKDGGVLYCVKNAAGKETYFYYDDHRTGQSKQYYFNPDLVFTDPEIIEINKATKRKTSKDPIVKATRRILARLKVSMKARQLQKLVRNQISFEYIRERCKVNEEIPPGHYYLARANEHDKDSGKPYDSKHLLEIALKNGLDLILYKNGKCYLDNADAFIWKRVYQTRTSDLDSLLKLKEIRKSVNVVCDRNDTNKRLDTNITTLASRYFNLLSLHGEPLVQIDLVNSQFILLARLMEISYQYLHQVDRKHFKEIYNITPGDRIRESIYRYNNKGINRKDRLTEIKKDFCLIYVTKFLAKHPEKYPLNSSLSADWKEFIELAKNGTFYEKAAELINESKKRPGTTNTDQWDRDKVKVAMFLTAFSAHRYNPIEKQILKAYYPALITLMNEFKKLQILKFEELHKTDPKQFSSLKEIRGLENLSNDKAARKLGNAQLAVMLQQIESGLFIDNILNKLLEHGFKVLSKHDSILCKESELNAVQAIIRAELDAFFGLDGYRLKIDRFI